MDIRRATPEDIPSMFDVRLAARENWLSKTALQDAGVTSTSVRDVLDSTGRGWVAEDGSRIAGFSIANAATAAIWAIFVLPEYEGRGLGRALLERAVDWLWTRDLDEIWLQTGNDPTTRAHAFYRSQGWQEAGRMPNGDRRYVLVRTT